MLLSGFSDTYIASCDRCAAVDLDPLQVLEQMLPSSRLADAVPVLAHMLRGRAHRRRHGSIVRNLWRSTSIAASADKVEVRGCLSPAACVAACIIDIVA